MISTVRNLIILLAASVTSAKVAEAQVANYGIANGILSFEKNTEYVACGNGSSISTSAEHSKLGTHSLKWDWSCSGAQISLPGDVQYLPENPNPKEKSVSSFVFWVYSPQAIDGSLRFSFRKEGKECCYFTYKLGFNGWRGSWVAFDRDMQGKPEVGMDEIVIIAPKGVKKGQLFFDGIIPASFQDVRHHTPDWQAPFVNEKTTNHWLVLNNSWKLKLDIKPRASLSLQERKDMRLIQDRFLELMTDKGKRLDYDQIKARYDRFGIHTNPDGTINGKPIYFVRYAETFLNQGIPDAKKTFKKNGQLLSDYNDFLLTVANAATAEKDSCKKEELTQMYINLTRHLLDQGFAAGSGQGTLHHLGYSLKNYYTSPLIMKKALVRAGLAEEVQKAMEWFSGVGEVKVAPKESGMDIDAFNTALMGRVASVLMLEDSPYKYAYLKAVSRWIDNGFKYTEGLRACFKTDGTVVHHRKAYPAYAVGGFNGAVNAVWMLSGTSLAVSEESHSNLKQALLAMQFYSYRDLFPLAMSGRHPDGKWSLNKEHYYRLALAGSPDRQEKIDKDLAYAYLTLLRSYERGDGYMLMSWETPINKKETHLKENGIVFKDARLPSGTRTFGFNCSMSHRHEGRLVTIAGHSRYMWATEIYNNANHYGRYLTHGSMQILAPEEPGRVGGGFYQPGWDWCHIPGTTAAVLPMHEMKADVLNVDEQSGYEEMLLSDEWFAGGVTHKGKNGAYAMKLHEHDKYNGSLRARKSFFTFENRIICLGSDIENSLEGAPVHTTLFQNYVGNAPSWEPMPVEGRNDILRDHSNALYFVNGGKIRFKVGLQQSLHEETDEPTEGYFEKAYIEHGDIIKGGEYEYLVYMPTSKDTFCQTGMESNADTIARYAADLPYKVLRKETNIHGVLDTPSGIRAFAVFEQGDVDETIIECSPAMVMYSVEDDTMTLSVSNPDLALYEGPSDEIFDENGKRIERSVYSRKWINNPCADTKVYMTLSGLWKIENADGVKIAAKHNNGNTALEFTSKEARTEEITLKKID